jgi:hypothetical protein
MFGNLAHQRIVFPERVAIRCTQRILHRVDAFLRGSVGILIAVEMDETVRYTARGLEHGRGG